MEFISIIGLALAAVTLMYWAYCMDEEEAERVTRRLKKVYDYDLKNPKDRARFIRAVKHCVAETIRPPYVIEDEIIEQAREDFFDGLVVNDMEEAIELFDSTFFDEWNRLQAIKEGWRHV